MVSKRRSKMTVARKACATAQPGRSLQRRRKISSFDPSYRSLIHDLARISPALEDLAETFPALLFAFATGYGSDESRQRAFHLVLAGAPLRAVASTIGLPYWLRKLPASALTEPLPVLPTDPDFAMRVTSFIPDTPGRVALWLHRVAHAYRGCNSDFAIWIARTGHALEHILTEDRLVLLAAWAWVSHRPELPAFRCLRRGWTSDISLARAIDEMTAWRQRLLLAESLDLSSDRDWLENGTIGGYNFVGLRTVADFVAESRTLDNCLDQYGAEMSGGRTAVFSIRRAGRTVACVEIGPHDRETSMPAIVQLKGPRNRRASADVWRAAYTWLGGQTLRPFQPRRKTTKVATRRTDVRRNLWQPYLDFLGSSLQHDRLLRVVFGAASSPIGMAGADMGRPRQRVLAIRPATSHRS